MLKTGKLDSDLLKSLVFEKIKYRNDDVKVRPGIGEDCAVVSYGDFDCIMSTDPITAAASEVGRLAIHITCNDIASNGVQPLGILLAVMLPEGTTEEDVAVIMGQAADTASEVGVEIIGGHTEITPSVNQPVIVSTAIGKAPADTSQTGDLMEEGDFIMITKSVGLEGTGIIAGDYASQLEGVLTEEEIKRAVSFLDRVSVVKEGVAAGRVGTHGMHDITEGGVLGAVWEMCQIAGVGAELDCSAVPVEPETVKVCRHFGINELRLISSGSMVIIVAEDKVQQLTDAMDEIGVPISAVGRIKSRDFGVMMKAEGELLPIEPPETDELYKVVCKSE